MQMHHPGLDTTIEVPDEEPCIRAHEATGWERVEDPTVEDKPKRAKPKTDPAAADDTSTKEN